MTTIRPMQPADKEAVLAMMEVFYASPAVLSNGSAAIFSSDFEACINDNPYLEGYMFEENGQIQGYAMAAKEMSDRVFVSGSYGEALCIIGEYVNITDSEPEHKNSLRQQLKATKPADPVKKQQTSKQQER